jgi:hypothetical protein
LRRKTSNTQRIGGADLAGACYLGLDYQSDSFRRNAGFTLLELVLATLIASLVIGILASALTFSLRVWEREQGRKGSEAPNMIELLKRQLANVDPVNILSAGESRPLFQGEEHSIVFTTDHSVRAISKGAPVVVRYFYSPGERLLYYAEIPLDPYHVDTIETFLNLQPAKESKKDSIFYSVEMTSFSLTYEQAEGEGAGGANKNNIYPAAIVVTWSADQDATPHYALVRPNSFFGRFPEQGGLKGSGSFD